MSGAATGMRSALCALMLLLAAPALALPPLVVSEPWIRATPPGAMAAAAYLVITNSGAAPDHLVEAHCDAAAEVMVHVTSRVDGVLQMRDGMLQVPAHGVARLAPKGSHLMLMGLKEPLRVGTTVHLRLHFARAGIVEVDVPVRPATGAEP